MHGAVKAFAIFIILELILLGVTLMILGPADETGTNRPLQVVLDICSSAGTTPHDLAVGVFIFGTFFSLILMFVLAVVLNRRSLFG